LTSPSSSRPYDYAYAASASGCPSSSYYAVGATYGGTTYSNSSGTCTAEAEPSYTFYDVTPFPVASFEPGTTSGPSGPFSGYRSGSRIQLKTVSSPDGARSLASWHDALLGVDCYFYTATDGATRCLPLSMGYLGTFFADSTCSTPLAYTGCGEAPAFGETTQGCGGSATYYSLGAAYSGPAYARSGSTCTLVAGPVLDPLYRVGAAVPASTFAEGTLSE
jgi:hypothetical protein